MTASEEFGEVPVEGRSENGYGRGKANGQGDGKGHEKPPEEADKPDLSKLCLTPAQWARREIEPEDFLLGAPFSTTSRGMFSAETGKGKTMICIGIAFAARLGRAFLHWKAGRPCRVLYIDGEMPRDLMQERIRLACEWFKVEPPEDGIFFLSKEDFEGMPPLDSEEWAAWMDAYIEALKPDFAILDNLMCLTVGNLKETDSWRLADPWIRSLSRRRVGVLIVHHLGHDKTKSYGDSSKEWALDYVILGEAVEHPGADISLKIEFKKARRRRPGSAADYATGTIVLQDGEWTWTPADKSDVSGGGLNDAGRVALAALCSAVAACGQKPPHHAATVGVNQAVGLSTWRLYYAQTAGYEQDEKGKEAERKQLERGRQKLKAAGKIQIWGEWVWPL
jgi:hypothetical protein